jgi:hypothetical protein
MKRVDATPTADAAQENTGFDLEGLMSDFPTATELEKFVFDSTGIVLNLKGRSNRFKYQTALDVLNGLDPDPSLLGAENPYVDRNEIVPMEPLRPSPPQPAEVWGHIPVVQFQCNTFPHPDPEFKASGQKCSVIFRKYIHDVITYEIIGPVSLRAIGQRVNKYGKDVPEKYVWVDPRAGEQIIRYGDGRVTPVGTRLRNFMSKMRVGNATQWETWIDRDFVIGGSAADALDNPWGN